MQPNQYVDENGNRKPDAPQGHNQFTTGKRTKHDEATRDKMRAEHLARRLYQYAAQEKDEEGREVEMDSGRIAAAKILIDKGKPSLQAVEQKTVNEMDEMSEAEILDLARALITANPGILQELGLSFAPQVVPVAHNNGTDKAA